MEEQRRMQKDEYNKRNMQNARAYRKRINNYKLNAKIANKIYNEH